MKHEKKQTGKVNYIWVLAGGYLVYLAIQIFKTVFAGDSDVPAVGIAGGVAFVAIGAWLMLREWRAYRYGMAHKDDPETWSDDPELPEECPQDPGEEKGEA